VPDDLRTRVLDATFAEVDEHGLSGLTVEAVAVRAGSSRATLYRHFPGGRDELIETTLRREVSRFVEALVAEAPTAGSRGGSPTQQIVDQVASLVSGAHRLLSHHRVFQRLLEEEAEAIAPPLATVHPMLHDAVAAHLAGLLESSGLLESAGKDSEPSLEAVADHGARMFLSYVGTAGSWALEDPEAARELVRTRILPGAVT
jgi:AcrR family transcriptional regulator